jgi:two-component system sensor histidine kinase BaeS
VSLSQLFGSVAATHAADCARRQIALTAAAETDADTVLGDPDRLEQVLQNLVANAIRHTPRRGTIELRATARENSVHITVTDTGEGIPAEHLSRVFDRFYKVSSSLVDRSSGSGLGLSIARAITERHGGTISVVSRPGETVFEIILPVADRRDLPPDLRPDLQPALRHDGHPQSHAPELVLPIAQNL